MKRADRDELSRFTFGFVSFAIADYRRLIELEKVSVRISQTRDLAKAGLFWRCFHADAVRHKTFELLLNIRDVKRNATSLGLRNLFTVVIFRRPYREVNLSDIARPMRFYPLDCDAPQRDAELLAIELSERLRILRKEQNRCNRQRRWRDRGWFGGVD